MQRSNSTNDFSFLWRPKHQKQAASLLEKFGYNTLYFVLNTVVVRGLDRTEDFRTRFARRKEFCTQRGIPFDVDEAILREREKIEKVLQDSRFSFVKSPFIKREAIMCVESGLADEKTVEEILRTVLGEASKEEVQAHWKELGLV